jgi:hypothetical protein
MDSAPETSEFNHVTVPVKGLHLNNAHTIAAKRPLAVSDSQTLLLYTIMYFQWNLENIFVFS